MIREGISAFKGKRVLLLQGPVGPFFRRLSRDLEAAGAHVTKINFNGGDWLFHPRRSIAFRGRMPDWPTFLEKVLVERSIDMVLLFGDCRPVHLMAHKMATRYRLEIGVFEEGYVRPDYITLERYGVNGNSLIPRIPAFYLNAPKMQAPPTVFVGNTYWHSVLWAIGYYLAAVLLWPAFSRYQHHRPLTLREAWPWVRGVWRKLRYAFKERGVQGELATTYSKRYFLIPLQVHNDAQIRMHSDYDSDQVFIDNAIASFAGHAPADTLLVIKHHPMDRGYHDHTLLIRRLSRRHGVEDRVRYIHDQHLPTLLEHARGVAVINSTVGFSALHHATPVHVCGTAIYDMEGLTYQGTLNDFWKAAREFVVSRELYERFRSYLIGHTQLNGSIYRRLPVAGSCAGVIWSPSSAEMTHVVPAPQPQVMTE